jgi:hypothetical protein
MVLVESGTETGNIVFRDGKSVNLIDTATGRSIPPIKTANPLRDSDITGNIRAQIEASAREVRHDVCGNEMKGSCAKREQRPQPKA